MNRRIFSIACLWMLALLTFTACGEDEYHYPSVKLEFVTIESGNDGHIQTVIPDKGEVLTVANDYTRSSITPNSSKRVLSNYEIEEGTSRANIYSLQAAIVLEPKQRDEGKEETEEDLPKDPVEVTSIWMGRDYLNMILNVKIKGGKPHSFQLFAEEEQATAEEGENVVILSLYHDANGDEAYYNRNAYISVPLTGLAAEEQTIRIKFKYYTTDENGQIILSDKYCNTDFEGFEYTPSNNH